MPEWRVPERKYELPRNIAILDTNVLVALVDPRDKLHEHTISALDLGEYNWVVTHTSLLEAWNLLGGREKRKDLAYKLVDWVLTPGQAILVCDAIETVSVAHIYSQKFGIDLVDASLIDLANRISREFAIKPAVHVATYDTRDFLRLLGQPDLSFSLYDMRDTSSTPVW